MEEREFTRYAFLIVAIVAIVGLLNSGFLEATGFASKESKDPTCLAAEKALVKAQTACKLAQNVYKPVPKKCDAAKKAYGLAQVSFAKTASEKTKSMMDQKKNAMDTACAAIETAQQNQDNACAFASQAADNKNVVCAASAPAQGQ